MTKDKIEAEVSRILNFLAGGPHLANAAVKRIVLQGIMLTTGGSILRQGKLRDIRQEHLGAGIYRVFLKPLRETPGDKEEQQCCAHVHKKLEEAEAEIKRLCDQEWEECHICKQRVHQLDDRDGTDDGTKPLCHCCEEDHTAEIKRLNAENHTFHERLGDIYKRATTAQRAVLGLDEGEEGGDEVPLTGALRQPIRAGEEKPLGLTRKVLYCYMDLPYITRIRIAQDLGILEDGDEKLIDVEKFKRVFERACDRGIQCEFRAAIDAATEHKRR